MKPAQACVAVVVLLFAHLCGCRSCGCREAAKLAPVAPPHGPTEPAAPIRQASAQVAVPAQKEPDKKEPGKQDEPKERIDLPTAIQLCTLQNFRLQASATKIAQAEADLLTASLIPNPSLFTDLQLLPLQRANFHNQLGPPQQDAIFSIPIDWLMFGKRVAAIQAQQLGVTVARAGQDEAVRRAVSDTVDTFYAALQAEGLLRLARENLEDAEQLQSALAERAAAGKATVADADRAKLAVLDATLALSEREMNLKIAKAKLRPLIGRTARDSDFDVVGTLDVKAVVPVPELEEALTLAEAHRPDLAGGRHAIAQAAAAITSEQRKAKPQVTLQPGWSYQYQRAITGFRNGSLLDVGVQFSLPLTDRNQGNIRKAQWQLAEARFTHAADLADVRAEVEMAVAAYDDAVDDVTHNNDPATLAAAIELGKKARTEFDTGQRKLVELLDARRAALDRRERDVEFRGTYWRALNKLNAVVGLTAYDPATSKTVPVEYGKDEEPKKK